MASDVEGHGHYINGGWVGADSAAQTEVLDPATNRPIARVPSGTREDVDAAVDAARHAFESPDWRDLDPSKRGRLLWLLGQQVRDRFDGLARLESLNVGKPLREAKGDVSKLDTRTDTKGRHQPARKQPRDNSVLDL